MEIIRMVCESIGAWMAASPTIGGIVINAIYYFICLLVAEIGWTSHRVWLLTSNPHTYYTYNKGATVIKIIVFIPLGVAYLYVNSFAWFDNWPSFYFQPTFWGAVALALSFGSPVLACVAKIQRQYNTRDAEP